MSTQERLEKDPDFLSKIITDMTHIPNNPCLSGRVHHIHAQKW
jgi:hypothetical protein